MKVRVRRIAAIWSNIRHFQRVSFRALSALAFLLAGPAWAAAQSPYYGNPLPIPGGIQAEDYDHGGQGVAYYDDSSGNSGGTYRWTDVDVEPTNGGGAAVGWIRAGEWLRYTVSVSTAGTYRITLRVASSGDGGTFHIEFNGQDRTGSLRIQNTWDWRGYQDLGATVYLDGGVQDMRIVFDSNGPTGFVGNLSFLQFDFTGGGSPTPAPAPSSPSSSPSAFGGTAWTLPGGVQAEDFDNGGNGAGYYDTSSGNSGGAYRSTDVDVENTWSGGYAVGWIVAGEWLRYTVNVTAAGQYTITARVASAGGGGTFHIDFNGVDKTGAMRIPDTGGWQTYQTISTSVWLEAGVQAMRLVFDSNGSTGFVGNVSFVQFDFGASAAPAPAPAPPDSGGGGGGSGGGRLRVLTWNIHFGHGDPLGQAHVIANSGADVALLQEASTFDEYMPQTYVDRLRQLTGQQWYSVWAPHGGRYTDNEGTLILSRLPLVDRSTMNSTERGFSRAVVNVGGVNVTILNAHLDWDASMRSAQLEAFISWGQQFGGPRIAGGDFNSWWGEWWIARMLQAHTDTWVDVTGSNENGYTLNSAVRFDYLFRAFDQNWRLNPTACWVQWTDRSDHSPVIADYDVR
jgi:endonuclease/exonuclease/phosphatase family metal-dependent hydrolase